jgi:hypothetical protein
MMIDDLTRRAAIEFREDRDCIPLSARTPSAPSPSAWLLRDALAEYAELLFSLCDSIVLATQRGDDIVATVHVRQSRLVLLEMLAVAKL